MDLQILNEDFSKLGTIEYLDYNGENKGIERFLIAMINFNPTMSNLTTFYSLLSTHLSSYEIGTFIMQNGILRVELNLIN